jgi:drug/metabolite transporter (DMT)-like permease
MKKYNKPAITAFILEIIGFISFGYSIMFSKIIDNNRPYFFFGIWVMLLGGIITHMSFQEFRKNPNLVGKTLSDIALFLLVSVIMLITGYWLL